MNRRRTLEDYQERAKTLIERRRSKIHGWGVFAKTQIKRSTKIINYAGEKITQKQSLPRQDKYLEKGHIWCFELNTRWVRDAGVGGNIARFINHKCKPNCWVDIEGDVIWIRAAKTIRKGEELGYDYETDGEKTIQCRCRPGCKRKL